MESKCVDVDLDGWFDLLISSTPMNPRYDRPHVALLPNNRDGTFRDATASHLPQSWTTGWIDRLYVSDLNRDGWPDIVASTDRAIPRLFIGQGGGRFAEQLLPDVFGYNLMYERIIPIDAGGDGRIDLLMPRHDQSFWLRNTGS